MSATSTRWTDRLAFAAVLALSTVALLWPALRNGYPLLRYDSAAYVRDALSLEFSPLRPPGYALFLRAALAAGTLWPALWIESFVTSLLALRLACAFCGDSCRGLLTGAGALTAAVLLTSLAAHTSTLMPDAFTSWLFLGPALCLVSLRRRDVWLGAGACFASILVHTSHLLVAVAGLLACALVARPWRPEAGLARVRLAALALAVALSVAASVALHHEFGGAPLGGHPAFVVARLHGHGLLVPTLDLHCQRRGWRLCAYREVLERVPRDEPGWWFLWNRQSPLLAIGGFEAAEPELREIARAGATSFAPQILVRSLEGGCRQLFSVETLQGVVPEPAQALAVTLQHELPAEARRVAASDQAFRPPVIVVFPSLEGWLHAALWVAALVAGIRWFGRRPRPAGAWLLAATAAFLVLHALVIGFGTAPIGRYQGRVAWLLAYVLPLAACRRLSSGEPEKPA